MRRVLTMCKKGTNLITSLFQVYLDKIKYLTKPKLVNSLTVFT